MKYTPLLLRFFSCDEGDGEFQCNYLPLFLPPFTELGVYIHAVEGEMLYSCTNTMVRLCLRTLYLRLYLENTPEHPCLQLLHPIQPPSSLLL